jgi:hypothetical protein
MPRIPLHLQKKRGPKPKLKMCYCGRPMFKKKHNSPVCKICYDIEAMDLKRRHTSGMRKRRANLQLAVEPYGWYDGGMNGRYNI